jgi:predicted 3-demethylubiquinone-9 3-methyltransferase (glyoxalase superfamily)
MPQYHRRGSGFAGLWFPASLMVLLLLALPAAVFLALHLLGREAYLNGWLKDRFGVTYHLPTPWWTGAALLIVPFLLILLYFLKLKRKPLQVPSTYLWRKSIEDLHVNSLFQWLRDNVFLLVQLLIVLLLIYAVLSLQVHGNTSAGKYYIVLIDNSASMNVVEFGKTRLEQAKEEALREIDAHAEGDNGMVIAFNSRASILQPYTGERSLLRAAVAKIEPTQRPTRIDEALQLASSLANPLRSTDDLAVRPANEDPAQARTYVAVEGIAAEAHLFSDGRFPDVSAFAAGNLDFHYHRIGAMEEEDVDNIALVALNATRDQRDGDNLSVFVRALNFRKVPAAVKLEIEWRVVGKDDFHLLERNLTLPGGKRLLAAERAAESAEVEEQPGEGEAVFVLNGVDDSANVVVHARLRDLRDRFPLDDEAWLVAGVVRKARVLIVTTGNDVLRDFFDLEATKKVANISYITPADLNNDEKYRTPARNGVYDLIVFDRCAPENKDALPLANTFFIGDVPPPHKRAALPPLKQSQIRNPTSSHPLMRYLTGLDEIAFSEAFRFDLKAPDVPARTPRLLETDRENAVLFVLSRGAFQDLVLAFPLIDAQGRWTTTWNLKLSFPIFLRNVLYLLGNVADAAAEENVQPGEMKILRPDTSVKSLEILAPDGRRETVSRSSGGDFSYKNTERVGVYEARWEGGSRRFAVNLFDVGESNIRPRDAVKIGEQQLAAGQSRQQTYDTWKWIVLAALVMLVLEWAAYHRRLFW